MYFLRSVLICLVIWQLLITKANALEVLILSNCLISHLRPLLSIALKLSNIPSVNVTLALPEFCTILKGRTYSFDVEYIPELYDYTKIVLTVENLGGLMYDLNKAYFNHFKEKWENKENKPDVIVSEIFTYAGNELGEIFNISNILVSQAISANQLMMYDETIPEYLDFHFMYSKLSASNNPLVRTIQFVIKKFMGILFKSLIQNGRNKLRAELGLLDYEDSEYRPFNLIESFYGFEEPRLLPSNYYLTGYFGNIFNDKTLDPEIEEYISEGVIYVSPGSLEFYSEENLEMFSKTFEMMKNYKFILTCKSCKEIKIKAENVKVLKWVNQNALLLSGKVLAFITHGGYSSTNECIEASVPSICIPFGKDQYHNCDRINELGAGKLRLFEEITPEGLKKDLIDVITLKTYKENIERLNNLKEMNGGIDRAVELIIFIGKFGHKHLVPKYYSLPWYQKKDLDIYGILLLAIIGLVKLVFYFFKKWRGKKQKLD